MNLGTVWLLLSLFISFSCRPTYKYTYLDPIISKPILEIYIFYSCAHLGAVGFLVSLLSILWQRNKREGNCHLFKYEANYCIFSNILQIFVKILCIFKHSPNIYQNLISFQALSRYLSKSHTSQLLECNTIFQASSDFLSRFGTAQQLQVS